MEYSKVVVDFNTVGNNNIFYRVTGVTEYLSINYINCKDANTNCRRQIADGAITNAKIKAEPLLKTIN
jgi:hypothetical protein